MTAVSYVHSVSTPSENLVNIEINYSDLNYKITQQQKAVSVPELLGKSDFFLSSRFLFRGWLGYQWWKKDQLPCVTPPHRILPKRPLMGILEFHIVIFPSGCPHHHVTTVECFRRFKSSVFHKGLHPGGM